MVYSVIRLEHISHGFQDSESKHHILNDINISIKEQEIFGLIGETGSGKSTLLRIMNGFIIPSEGTVFLMDQLLDSKNKLEQVRQTATLFQNFNLLSNLNVIDNVILPNKLLKFDKNKSMEKAKMYLKYVGLEGFEKRHIKTLSGGQKQRVAIARTLMRDPKIIFCDEPTSALDTKVRAEILTLLKSINQDMKTTIVIVSHDISVIQSLCDRVAILESGQIKNILDVEKKAIYSPSYQEALSS